MVRREDITLSPRDRKFGTFLLFSALIFYYVRPQEFIPGLDAIPIAGAFVYGCSLWGLFHLRKAVFRTPIVIVLVIGIIVSLSAIGATNVNALKASIFHIFQLFPLCVTMYILTDTSNRLDRLLQLWLVIYFFVAVITIARGGLGPGNFVLDPNDTSLALAMGLPYFVYLAQSKKMSQRHRWLLRMAAIIVVVAIVSTRSRGGFVGLAGVVLAFWWLSRQRIKLAIISIVAVSVFGGIMLSILPDDYQREIVSIVDDESSTRVERLRTWEIAWLMYKDNPVIGVGAGNFMYNAATYQRQTSWWTDHEKSLQGRVTHSVYFQIISELGTVGAIAFGFIMFVSPLRLYGRRNKLVREKQLGSRTYLHYQILMVSMGAFLLSGAFISVAYYPHLAVWITMYSLVIEGAQEEKKSSVGAV